MEFGKTKRVRMGGSRKDQKCFGRTKSFRDDMWTKTSFKAPNRILFWKLIYISDDPNCSLKKVVFPLNLLSPRCPSAKMRQTATRSTSRTTTRLVAISRWRDDILAISRWRDDISKHH